MAERRMVSCVRCSDTPYRALILLGLALYLSSASVSLVFMVLYV